MTDLCHVGAAYIHPDNNVREAEQQMKEQGTRMLFVVSRLPGVDGIVTWGMMHGLRAMQVVQAQRLRHEEIRVADVMSPLHDLEVVDYAAMQRATVRDVDEALHRCGCTHLLVAEAATSGHGIRIRGVISLNRLQCALGNGIPIVQVASTFADIARALM